MKRITYLLMALLGTGLFSPLAAQRSETVLDTGWRFHRGEAQGAEAINYNASKWQSVTVPHDWAITGPFSRDNDLQRVAVTQNFETEATVKTGRTGDCLMSGWDGIAAHSVLLLVSAPLWYLMAQ